MSPRLLFLLSNRYLPAIGRDRIDAELAAARYSPRHARVSTAAFAGDHDDIALPTAA